MKVDIVTATPYPMDAIAMAAGTCYGKADPNPKRVASCYKAGHMAVFEHASVTFRVEGISRACSHQLVRHRLASFCQESQRYCKVDLDTDWYVTPPWFEEGANRMFIDDYHRAMAAAAFNYLQGLKEGMKPEDARYMLPEATKTAITVTMNARELFHFLDLRQSQAAQWEIRELANEVERCVGEYAGRQWRELMLLREGGAE